MIRVYKGITMARVGLNSARLNSVLFSSVLLGSVLLGISYPTSAAAETPKEPNWYQVELVVFTQPRPNLKAEYWQEQLQPTFTYNAIQLKPSAGFESVQGTESRVKSSVEINPRLVHELPRPLLQEYSDGAFTLLTQELLNQQPKLNEPILPIDTAQLERRGHRILFQGQWRQPVLEKEQARSIVIRGGQSLAADFFELEGDIQLSLSRYIHLRPNLYYTLTLPPEWQPRHPKEIQALANALPTNTESKFTALTESDSIPSSAVISAGPNALLPEQQPPQISYLSLPLDQPKRMRRNELHYIDHPLFGLLIRLTAYTPEPKVLAIPVEPIPSSSSATTSAAEPTQLDPASLDQNG